jgi:PAS domain S-box-containing protein
LKSTKPDIFAGNTPGRGKRFHMFDMRTIVSSYAISNIICVVVIGLLWYQSRRRFAGLGFWLADFIMQFVALVLIALRGIVPDFVSMVVSNTLVIGGTILLYIGLERFTGKRSSQIHNYLLLIAFFIIQMYFAVFVDPNPWLWARNINISVALILVCSQCAWLVMHRVDADLRTITRGVGHIFIAFGVLSMVRIFGDVAVHPQDDFFKSGLFETVYILANQMLFIILTFGLFLTVNRRLVVNLETDITERKKTEAALRTSEEKFYKAFQASPDSITISRASDGRLIEVNDGFLHLTGYSQEEALASSSVALNLYTNQEDREKIVTTLRQGGSLRDWAIDFRTRAGDILNCLYSGEIIQLGGEAHVLSVVRDITARKRSDETLQKQTTTLTERIKELNCIGELSHLIETRGVSLDEILQRSIELLQAAMQYPEKAGVKLLVEQLTYTTENCKDSENKLSSNIMDGEHAVGSLEVYYPSGNHHGKQYIFWEEEKRLLDIVAGKLGQVIERVRVEAALHQSEALYRQMFSSHSAVMILVDPESGSIVEANPSAAEFYGYPLEVLQQMTVYQINTRTHAEIETILQDARNRIQNYYTVPHRLASGEIREVEIHTVPVEIAGRQMLYSIIHDITERKRLDESLRHQNEVLASLHQATMDLINRHEVEDVLQAFLREIGNLLEAPQISIDLLEEGDVLVTRAATPGQPLQAGDRMRHGDGGWLSWKAIETGEPVTIDDYSVWSKRRPLYEDFPIHAIMVIPIHHRNQIIGNINISRSEPNKPFNDMDINLALQLAQMIALILDNAQLYTQLQHELNERRQVEEALRISESRLQTALTVGQVGYWDWDLKTNDVAWSEQTYRMFGLEPTQPAPQLDEVVDRMPPEDAAIVQSRLEAAIRGEVPYNLEHRVTRIDGSLLHVHAQAEVFRDADGKPLRVLGTIHDISGQKQNEENLLKLTAIEERQRLARDLHDSVNQSIHSLVLFSETLGALIQKKSFDRATQISERLQESARQALKETRLMLFELRPPDSGTDFDLIRNIETRLAMVEQRAGIRTEIIQEGSIESCPPQWRADLFFIIIEALNNSLKHAQARSVTVTIRCLPPNLDVKVVDNGKGFEPAKPHAGGLGLQSMRERASLLGGELEIDSAPQKGTCIRFSAKMEA